MQELLRLLESRGIHFHPVEQRILCFPHIINICVRHILNDYWKADFSGVVDRWVVEGKTINKDTYVEAIQGKALDQVRLLICTIRASDKQCNSFRVIITTGNDEKWFQDDSGAIIQLPVVQLLHDEPTRWDSTYVMLNHLQTLRQAMDLFCDSPLQCHMINKKLSLMEWLVLQDFKVILEAPHTAQQTMSSKSTPILSGAVPTFEKMIQCWNCAFS
ncbi:uncharacterized protein EDB91DRAFT_1061236 [Suillus paluster]|uniref:uncharacterized protein n=1 Tax=Suillus paluster TaxID=48578 RepID=UPI001B85C15D|nr:uncharacterized protein EDB91DRAFT_1061236 [Suillus paluster]KAG1727189.1 hypothetical protein EDB91DRAFT_1061236 [Suillus paluster]